MAVTNGWGKGAQNNSNGWGKSGTNNIGYGAIYESSAAGDTSIIGTSASFLYSKSSFNQGEADPTPTITGTTGGSFNASANVVFVDTGTFNSSTGQIDLSATSIGSHIITYTVNGVQSGQTVGVESIPYASTSSFTFDGVNDYFDLGNNASLYPNTSDMSYSFWFNSDSLSGYKVLFSQGAANLNVLSQGDKAVFITTLGDELRVFVCSNTGGFGNDSNNAFDTSNANFVVNQWYHIVFTLDRDGDAVIYVNGVANVTQAVKSSSSSVDIVDTDNTIIGGVAYNFAGNIDELSIWNTALSQSAVTEIYNSGAPNDLTSLSNASNTNLKAWYKF